ncbi:MAG: AtpZ/AtpI family protein [Clostridia bacterium]|nr:AtpZ/AtpI family protein [Clostridia bacterium]
MKSFMNTMYALNIVWQSFWNLLFPVGLGILIGWLLTEKCGMGDYVFVIFILLGVLVGLVSMIRFLLSALAGLERLEKEQQSKNNFRE